MWEFTTVIIVVLLILLLWSWYGFETMTSDCSGKYESRDKKGRCVCKGGADKYGNCQNPAPFPFNL